LNIKSDLILTFFLIFIVVNSHFIYVFLFLANNPKSKISVLVRNEDRILGALREGGDFSIDVCPGNTIFDFEKRISNELASIANNSIAVTVEENKNIYLGVTLDGMGDIAVKQYTEETTLPIIDKYTTQTFLINRITPICSD